MKRFKIVFTVNGDRVEGPTFSEDLARETVASCETIIKEQELTNITVCLEEAE